MQGCRAADKVDHPPPLPHPLPTWYLFSASQVDKTAYGLLHLRTPAVNASQTHHTRPYTQQTHKHTHTHTHLPCPTLHRNFQSKEKAQRLLDAAGHPSFKKDIGRTQGRRFNMQRAGITAFSCQWVRSDWPTNRDDEPGVNMYLDSIPKCIWHLEKSTHLITTSADPYQ
ncbi:hypothetical protein L209DRAFT_476622 [Thermothelomyces heterothallicus CBS 203.75]